MDRRTFLSGLLAGAVATADGLWYPGKKTISIPSKKVFTFEDMTGSVTWGHLVDASGKILASIRGDSTRAGNTVFLHADTDSVIERTGTAERIKFTKAALADLGDPGLIPSSTSLSCPVNVTQGNGFTLEPLSVTFRD